MFLILIYFLSIPASAADSAAANPNSIKTRLANNWRTFFINGIPVCSNGPKSLPRSSPKCTILDNWVFDSLKLTGKLFAKALQRFVTYLLGNNNLCAKLVSSSELPIIFDVNLETTSASFFMADFNLLSGKFDSYTFKLLYWVILY